MWGPGLCEARGAGLGRFPGHVRPSWSHDDASVHRAASSSPTTNGADGRQTAPVARGPRGAR